MTIRDQFISDTLNVGLITLSAGDIVQFPIELPSMSINTVGTSPDLTNTGFTYDSYILRRRRIFYKYILHRPTLQVTGESNTDTIKNYYRDALPGFMNTISTIAGQYHKIEDGTLVVSTVVVSNFRVLNVNSIVRYWELQP